MLDVHPPHGKLEGIKDFGLHIFTITVGLFIALFLEGLMEQHHKNELRDQAEINLRQELVDNQKKLAEWQPVMQQELKNVKLVMDFIAARRAGKTLDLSHIQLGYSIRSLQDASWRTATATGALALIDYDEVQRYAGAYQVQEQEMSLQSTTLDDFLKLQSYATYIDPTQATPAQLDAAAPDAARAYAHLGAMLSVGDSLAHVYTDVLKGEAKK